MAFCLQEEKRLPSVHCSLLASGEERRARGTQAANCLSRNSTPPFSMSRAYAAPGGGYGSRRWGPLQAQSCSLANGLKTALHTKNLQSNARVW